MRLSEQRDTLIEAIEDAGLDLVAMRAAIIRKIAAPYGDGSRSNMVNAETDVLPRVQALIERLHRAMDEISGGQHYNHFQPKQEAIYMVGSRWNQISESAEPTMMTKADAKRRCDELNLCDEVRKDGNSPFFVTTKRDYAAE